MTQHQLKRFEILEENEISNIIDLFKRNYYLFLLGVLIALSVAVIINKFSTPIYKVSATILIRDNKGQNQTPSSVGGFLDLTTLMGGNKNFNNELLILKSSPLIEKTIHELNLTVSYYKKNKWDFVDAYHEVPFKVLYSPKHPQIVGLRFGINYLNDSVIAVAGEAKGCSIYDYQNNQVLGDLKNYKVSLKGKLGQLIENQNFSFIIISDTTQKVKRDRSQYYFEFEGYDNILENYKESIEFKVVDIEATAIEFSIKSPSYKKGVDILSTISQVYLNEILRKKNHTASVTIDYIDKQLGNISDSLSNTEQRLQNYRSENKIINVSEQSTGISTEFRDLQSRLSEIISRKKYYEYVQDYLEKNKNISSIIAPASMGVQDPLLSNLMSELIKSQSEKNVLLENRQERSPYLKQLDIKIENLKKTIIANIGSILKTTDITIEELSKRIGGVKNEITKLPKTERELLGIERKFKLNNDIYTYLLEKRAEANIMKASNMPDHELIEPAKPVSGLPVSPNKRMNYIVALILGLVVPFSYLRIKRALSNKIDRQENISRITDFPVIGKILHNNKRISNVVLLFPNSIISESFRTLRTNLEFYLRGSQNRVILVSSSIESEGKSFVSLNIAMSYAMLNCKTVLLTFDLRKGDNYSNLKEEVGGLTSYLINKADLEDVVVHTEHEMLDYIPAGPIPPNPIELIGLGKTEMLFNQLKNKYDYIVVDTSPIGMVSDAYTLMKYADVKLIVVRYNRTRKNIFSSVIKDLNQKQIEGICILLNDNKVYNEQYGYGYYSSEAKNRKKSMFKKK